MPPSPKTPEERLNDIEAKWAQHESLLALLKAKQDEHDARLAAYLAANPPSPNGRP